MAGFLFTLLIFHFSFLMLPCQAQDINLKSKSSLVKGILQKLFNLTLASFADTPIEGREKMMVKIEEKLNKSAQFLGPKKEKYVGLIMEGVKSIASEAGSKHLSNIQTDSNSEEEDYDEIYSTDNEQLQILNTAFEKANIKETAKKMKSNAVKQKKYVSGIQKTIDDSAFKKQAMMSFKKDTGSLHNDIINQRIIRTMAKDKNEIDTKDNEVRRMEFEFIDKINVNKVDNAENMRSKEVDAPFYDHPFEPINVTLKLPCQDKNAMNCIQIKALRTMKCSGKTISLGKLCDGIDDCFDYSDERDCAIQGVDKVRNASQLMSDIENIISNNCVATKIDDSIIRKQNEILGNVLQTQLKFIQKHATVITTNFKQSNLRRLYTEPDNVRKTVNEVAMVITTLSVALERTFCSSAITEARKFNEIKDELQQVFDPESVKTSTSDCQCIEEYCVGSCSKDCDLVCLQRYQISRWQCNAVSNKKTISLDLICDGKLDCYDEADESGCITVSGFGKFEANNMYNLVIDMISTKSKVINIKKVRSMLVNLQILVETLQKATTKRKPDVIEVKALRDKCFAEIVAIYDQIRYYKVPMVVLNDIHVFLMSMNEKLINAMKHSHTGNDRIISSDGCFCRDNKCALLKCSKKCIRACPAEPKLTRYLCGGSSAINQSIPIEAICNGKDDCPDKEDEENCSEEICRGHHLVVLRHNLEEAIEEDSGTTIGEALRTWKTKQVSATIKVLESNERPTHKTLRDLVNGMLHDLVMTYASLTSSRRDNDQVINQFHRMALVVIGSLRSCAK